MKYGTSGFRDHHTKILNISEKIGMAVTLLAHYKKESFGIMITASHNHHEDNGVKIMNHKGNMITNDIESYLENFINNMDINEYISDFGIKDEICDENVKIIIGYDSRASSPRICDEIISGIQKINQDFRWYVIKHITTPQLHFVFSSLKIDYVDYLKRIIRNLQFPCILDCANGIGARVMKKLNHRPIYLINTSWNTPELLNEQCSSDYVCNYKTTPQTPDYLTDLPYLRASLDGDADRIVFYYGENDNLNILNGDYIAALILTYLSKKLVNKSELNIGFVYTGYTNSACINYVKSLKFQENIKVNYCCTATGVKHLHKEAIKYDISVYFEQNGHGNVVFNKDIRELESLKMFFHPNIGDGIMDFLSVLFILQELKMSPQEWFNLYTPYYTILSKYVVQDKNGFESTPNELKLTQPEHLQEYIDDLSTKNGCRIFIRASGTENCIRIYVENEIEQINNKVYKKLTQYIDKKVNNVLFKKKERIFSFRFLHKDDINEDYYNLLGQLTQIDVSKMSINKTHKMIDKLNNNHRIFVIEDCLVNNVIASGTILIEEKLIRNYGKVGHIEDIVVNNNYRGFGIGKELIEMITEYAKNHGCYKCILDCSDDNVGFYEKCKYVRKGAQMALYYDV